MVGNYHGNNYFECESDEDRNNTLKYSKNILMDFDHTWKISKIIWKKLYLEIQLTLAISFMSCEDSYEERVMHSKSDNKEIKIKDQADEGVKKVSESLLSKYQIGSEKNTKGGSFISDCVDILHYKCY